jgi:rubrerythrin
MDIRQALEVAIEAEVAARDRYMDMAKLAEDGETRLLLEQIAREEESHLKRLKERLKAIKLMEA